MRGRAGKTSVLRAVATAGFSGRDSVAHYLGCSIQSGFTETPLAPSGAAGDARRLTSCSSCRRGQRPCRDGGRVLACGGQRPCRHGGCGACAGRADEHSVGETRLRLTRPQVIIACDLCARALHF